VAVALADLPHFRGVDDRQGLREVVAQQAVEEGLVAVLQGAEEEEPLQVGRLLQEVLIAAGHLLLHGAHPGGQQPGQAEVVPLLLGEGGALVQQRAVQQQPAAEGDLKGRLPRALVQNFLDASVWGHRDACAPSTTTRRRH
jgi:hypothetical protein